MIDLKDQIKEYINEKIRFLGDIKSRIYIRRILNFKHRGDVGERYY